MATRPQFDLRVLLVEPDAALRATTANTLLAAGYKVSGLADLEEAPPFVPNLYDVIVVRVDGLHRISLRWCEPADPGIRPDVVLLADSSFALDAAHLPSLIITEKTQRAIEEELLAFLAARAGVPRRREVPHV